MVKGKFIFMFDDTKKSHFGILPRYAKDDHEMRWFELPSCFIFHNGFLSLLFSFNCLQIDADYLHFFAKIICNLL